MHISIHINKQQLVLKESFNSILIFKARLLFCAQQRGFKIVFSCVSAGKSINGTAKIMCFQVCFEGTVTAAVQNSNDYDRA